jgi:prepilin-type processing-associated H-X9-DG protein
MAVAEYLKGLDENDVRGFFWSNRAGLQTLYVQLGPNSTAEDSFHPSHCPAGSSQPSMNLPCNGSGEPYGYAGSRSRHPGGVNVLLGDGSVHFVNQSISLSVWRALATIAGGEVVDGF